MSCHTKSLRRRLCHHSGSYWRPTFPSFLLLWLSSGTFLRDIGVYFWLRFVVLQCLSLRRVNPVNMMMMLSLTLYPLCLLQVETVAAPTWCGCGFKGDTGCLQVGKSSNNQLICLLVPVTIYSTLGSSGPSPPLGNIRVMVIVWRLRWNIIRTALCWIVWHNVHSPQHTYVSSSYRFIRLALSHWDPYAVRRGGCLELYYCNMVEWFWWDSSLIFDDQVVCFSALTLLVWSSGL